MKKRDYISLTDMAKANGQDRAINAWLRTKGTMRFLGLWEQMYNPDFKLHEFVWFRNQAGENSFNPSVSQWIEQTRAVGIISKQGRYGGTYAHKDIAFEFATWLSPEFKFWLIQEFDRLKQTELRNQSLEWNLSRTLAKINYRIHTDAVKEFLIPPEVTKEQARSYYADEADLLNVALFGTTASSWRKENLTLAKDGNIRDFAPLEHLIVLSNLESLNAVFIAEGLNSENRIIRLNQTAITQLRSLYSDKRIQQLQSCTP